MTYERYRRERDDYQTNPSYVHPETGAPLKEPYKPSKKRGLVTVGGKPLPPRMKRKKP